MFQLFFFSSLMALLLYLLLPRYLLSIYQRYRGDPYWVEVRPYKKRYSYRWVVLLFLLTSLQLSELKTPQLVYLLFIAFLLTLSWFDLKLRILPNELLFGFALSGLIYSYFVINSNIYLHLATVVFCFACAKIVEIFAAVLRNNQINWGLGAGDVKFIIALLCWFDGLSTLRILAFACCMALVVVIVSRIFLTQWIKSVAFGPYLSFAAYIIWWYG